MPQEQHNIQVVIDTSRVRAGLQRVNGQLGATDAAGARLGATLTRAVGVLAGGALFTNLVRGISSFETGIAEISTLVDTAVFDIDRLNEAALAQAGQYGQDPQQVVKAYYDTVSAGASTAAEAIQVVDAANRLAIAGVTNVSVATDGLTSVLNAYGLAASDATRISDTLFVGVRAGKTTIDQLASSIGKVAPIAASAGVEFDELVAAAAALTAGGISTREAMTGIRGILAAVVKPTQQATEAADALGLQFNATALETQGLQLFLENIVSATGGSTESMAQLFGGVEALVPVLALAGEAGDKFNETMVAMGNSAGVTEEAFQKISNTTAAEFNRAIREAQTSVIEGLQGALMTTIPAIGLLADGISLIGTNLDTFGIAVAALSLFLARNLISGLLATGRNAVLASTRVAALTLSFGGASAAAVLFSSAMAGLQGAMAFLAANPVGAAIIGFGILVGYLSTLKSDTERFDELIGSASGEAKALADEFGKITDSIREGDTALRNSSIFELLERLQETERVAQDIFGGGNLFTQIFEGSGDVEKAIGEALRGTGGNILQGLRTDPSRLTGLLGNVVVDYRALLESLNDPAGSPTVDAGQLDTIEALIERIREYTKANEDLTESEIEHLKAVDDALVRTGRFLIAQRYAINQLAEQRAVTVDYTDELRAARTASDEWNDSLENQQRIAQAATDEIDINVGLLREYVPELAEQDRITRELSDAEFLLLQIEIQLRELRNTGVINIRQYNFVLQEHRRVHGLVTDAIKASGDATVKLATDFGQGEKAAATATAIYSAQADALYRIGRSAEALQDLRLGDPQFADAAELIKEVNRLLDLGDVAQDGFLIKLRAGTIDEDYYKAEVRKISEEIHSQFEAFKNNNTSVGQDATRLRDLLVEYRGSSQLNSIGNELERSIARERLEFEKLSKEIEQHRIDTIDFYESIREQDPLASTFSERGIEKTNIRAKLDQKELNEAFNRNVASFKRDLADSANSTNEDLERQIALRKELRGGIDDLIQRQSDLNILFDADQITTEQYASSIRDLKVEFTALNNTPLGGIENGLARIAARANDVGTIFSDYIVNSIDSATNALVEWAKTGEFNVRSFFQNLAAELLRIATNQLITGFLGSIGFGAIFGGSSTTIGSALGFNPFANTGSIPAAANGLSFTVGGQGGTDSQLVRFLATPGETVDVRTPAQQRGQYAMPVVNVAGPRINITAINNARGVRQRVEYVSPTEARVIAEETATAVLARDSDKVSARNAANPNSKFSQALTRHTQTGRRY